MNKYVKLVLGIAALVVLIGGSSLLYNNLSKEYQANNLRPMGGQTQVNAGDNDVISDNNEGMVAPEEMLNSELNATPEVTSEPTPEPTQEPAPEPTQEPTPEPMPEPTAEPTPAPTQTPDTNVNPAPDFTVYDAAGGEVHLSDFVGKPVILNFWASWCGPCKSEMPLFQQMYDTYGADITFMVVNLTDGYSETVETAQAYIDGAGYTFPVYFDSNQDAAYTYYVTSIPTTYFIDDNGNLIAYAQGALTEDMFKQGLSMLGF